MSRASANGHGDVELWQPSTGQSACSLQREPIDALEVYEHIRDITDPEHPYTLEQVCKASLTCSTCVNHVWLVDWLSCLHDA
jgi:hypothetical protein